MRSFLNKSYTLILFIFILIVSNIYSQDNLINYHEYEYPNVHRRTLNFDLNLQGGYSQNKYSIIEEKNSSLSNRFNITYTSFINDENTQAFSLISLNSDYNYTKNIISKSTNFRPNIYLQGTKRTFDNENRFVEWGYRGQIFYNQSSRNIPTQMEKNASVFLRIPIRIGIGRIQPIEDVFLAKFMIDDLLEAGVLLENLTQEQLFLFANEIGILQNQRVFDTRRFRLHILKSLSEYMTSNFDIDSQKIIELVSIITDNWYGAWLGNRNAGKSFSFGIAPEYFISNNFLTKESYSISQGLDISFVYDVQKPISKSFQKRTLITLGFNAAKNSESLNNDNNHIRTNPYFNASHGYSYYPNSRTFLDINGSVSYNNLFINHIANFVQNSIRNTITPSINFSTSYFINNNVRATGSLNTNYYYFLEKKPDNIFFPELDTLTKRFYMTFNTGIAYIFY